MVVRIYCYFLKGILNGLKMQLISHCRWSGALRPPAGCIIAVHMISNHFLRYLGDSSGFDCNSKGCQQCDHQLLQQ